MNKLLSVDKLRCMCKCKKIPGFTLTGILKKIIEECKS